MPSPLAEAFLMGILNGCYETPSNTISRIVCGNSACRWNNHKDISSPPLWN